MEPLVETGADPRAQAAELGYLFFRGALEPELVLAARREVLARLELEWVALQAAVLVLPEVDALRRHPFVAATLGRVFGRAAEPGHGDVCRVVAPAEPATRPHQDAAYARSDLWTAWIPLGDCPRRLGGLAVWPGSQRRGILEHGEGTAGAVVPDDAAWASADYRCGDVLLFSALTLHRALPNESDETRLSVDFRYAPG